MQSYIKPGQVQVNQGCPQDDHKKLHILSYSVLFSSISARLHSTKSTELDTKVMRTCLCSFLFEQQILSTSILGCVSVHGIPGPAIKQLFVGSGFVRMESIS